MGQFLAALKDEDPNVRRVALVAFNSAAHNKPSLVRDLLDDVLPQLYEETKVKVGHLIFNSLSHTILQFLFCLLYICAAMNMLLTKCVFLSVEEADSRG